MTVLEEHEERLDTVEKDVVEIKGTVTEIDSKIDVVVSTNEGIASAVSTIVTNQRVIKKSKEGEGYIQAGNWRAVLASIVTFTLAIGVVALQMYLILPIEYFLPSLVAASMTSIYTLIKDLTGKTVKDLNLSNDLQKVVVNKAHKMEMNNVQGILSMKNLEVFGLKEKIARLETRQEIIKKESIIKLPPTQ